MTIPSSFLEGISTQNHNNLKYNIYCFHKHLKRGVIQSTIDNILQYQDVLIPAMWVLITEECRMCLYQKQKWDDRELVCILIKDVNAHDRYMHKLGISEDYDLRGHLDSLSQDDCISFGEIRKQM